MGPVGQGGHLLVPNMFYDGFVLTWCNFKFEGVPKFPEHVCLSACPDEDYSRTALCAPN
jgi:hypothetical protein